MSFFNFLSLIGGLALFLYGMDMMSKSLSSISGPKLKAILGNLTSNKLKGVALGAIVTALIQSSSGTTVIVVGLVNSGIMKLMQAVSVIMGANIGTTFTAWILSLASLSSENFFIQMLKPSSFSPILAVIGVISLFRHKSERQVQMGQVLLGFAILMFGMETMSNAMLPLGESPEFSRALLYFKNPVLGILSGAIVTAIVQSSSASIGILQSLANTGLVNYSTAMPIIMGQNIGTCATALISTIGAKRNAKRTAVIHLLFNIFGTLFFMITFYAVHALKPFPFMDSTVQPVGIALTHTAMNLLATVILYPASNKLVELAYRIIPVTEDEETRDVEFERLDDRLLENPSIALQQSFELSVQMFKNSRDALYLSLELLENFDETTFRRVAAIEDRVDRYEDKLLNYMMKISKKTLIEVDSHTQALILSCIGDFERIADHSKNISESAYEMHNKGLSFTTQATHELSVYRQATLDLVDMALHVYETQDLDMAISIEPLEELIDYMNDEINVRHVDRMREGLCSIEMGFILQDISTSLERIADHCSNVGVAVLTSGDDEDRSHVYLDLIRKDSNTFTQRYEENREKYILPDRRAYID